VKAEMEVKIPPILRSRASFMHLMASIITPPLLGESSTESFTSNVSGTFEVNSGDTFFSLTESLVQV